MTRCLGLRTLPTQSEVMNIVVYSGPGVGDRSLLDAVRTLGRICPHARVSTITAAETRTRTWHHTTTLFVMPGGRDLPYCAELNGVGTQSIQLFVRNGGRYLGFCAGAYFACSSVEFERGTPNEVVGERELKFFAGAGVGSALTPGAFDYENQRSARIALVSSQNASPVQVYFDGGCYFRGEDRNMRVVSRYLDLPEQHPAAIVCSIDQGKALLLGIHPEISANVGGEPEFHRPEINAVLAGNEHERDAYLLSLLDALEIRDLIGDVEHA